MKKTQASPSEPEPLKDLDLIANGARLVSLTFSVTLYTDVLLSSIPQPVLGCFEKFLQLCPPERLKFYATENMRQHKPVNKRVLNMLATWLKPGAPPREYIALELKDGDDFTWGPKFRFYIWGNEPGSISHLTNDANLIHMSFPPEWGVERTEEMLQLVRELSAIFPYQSGHASFCFLCSQYEKKKSQNYAWAKSDATSRH